MKDKLTRQITLQVALVIFGAMLIYAVFQALAGEASPVVLFFRHLWHSVVLGALVYVFLLWRLRALVFRPLQLVFFHGFQISKGRFDTHEYPRTGNELDNVTAMMNLIASHLRFVQETSWAKYADSVEQHLELLRARDDLPKEAYAELSAIRDNLRKMEVAIMEFLEPPAKSQRADTES